MTNLANVQTFKGSTNSFVINSKDDSFGHVVAQCKSIISSTFGKYTIDECEIEYKVAFVNGRAITTVK